MAVGNNAGLTAEELPEETVSAGDIIEYYSPMHGFGDRRGHKFGRVLRVGWSDTEYPLGLDTEELLSRTTMIKRVTASEPSGKRTHSFWRKIKTMILVRGTVPGATRADQLNATIREITTVAVSSFAHGRAHRAFPAAFGPAPLAPTTPDEPAPHTSCEIVSTVPQTVSESIPVESAESEEDLTWWLDANLLVDPQHSFIRPFTERETPAPVSSGGAHAGAPPPPDRSPPAAIPPVYESDDDFEFFIGQDDPSRSQAVTVRVSQSRPPKSPRLPRPPVWPTSVRFIAKNVNPERAVFPDIDLGRCLCSRRGVLADGNIWCCANASTAVYCVDANCSIADCVNRIALPYPVRLSETRTGLGVLATAPLFEGQRVGEYVGVLTTSVADAQASAYAVQIEFLSSKKKVVYIDARKCGGIPRFINHSCNPNCKFFEWRYRKRVRVLVVVVSPICENAELTVRYNGEDLGFTCRCGESNCVTRQSNTNTDK